MSVSESVSQWVLPQFCFPQKTQPLNQITSNLLCTYFVYRSLPIWFICSKLYPNWPSGGHFDFLLKICKWLLLRNRWTKSLQIWCAHTSYWSLPILFICWQFNPKCPNGGHFDFLNYKYAKSHFSPIKTWEFQFFHKYVIKLLSPKESSAAIRITKFPKMADLWPFCDSQMCKITQNHIFHL